MDSDPHDFSQVNRLARAFVEERDWAQFHSPKNLSMALAGESGELLEIFQWLTEEDSQKIMDDDRKAQSVREELADVLLYVLRLSDVLGIDLREAALAKIRINEGKYPVALARGSAKKYTELGGGGEV